MSKRFVILANMVGSSTVGSHHSQGDVVEASDFREGELDRLLNLSPPAVREATALEARHAKVTLTVGATDVRHQSQEAILAQKDAELTRLREQVATHQAKAASAEQLARERADAAEALRRDLAAAREETDKARRGSTTPSASPGPVVGESVQGNAFPSSGDTPPAPVQESAEQSTWFGGKKGKKDKSKADLDT